MSRRTLSLMTESRPLLPRLVVAASLMAMVHVLGTVGYWVLSKVTLPADEQYALLDCAYMTVISVTTVGYGEHIDVHAMPGGKSFTAALILVGGGIELYVLSVLTTFFVEGHLFNIRQLARIQKIVNGMSEHIVVAGAGRSGYHIAEELARAGHPFVAVDRDRERLNRVLELQELAHQPVGVVVGDATDEETLLEAGLDRASRLVVSLDDDQATLYAVMVARALNPECFIVAKSADAKTVTLLERGGADRVVATKAVSGMRLASETIRPHVVDFLAEMVRDSEHAMRFEEVEVAPDSRLAGATVHALAEHWARDDLALVAVKRAGAAPVYGPRDDFEFRSGDVLIVISDTQSGEIIRGLAGASRA